MLSMKARMRRERWKKRKKQIDEQHMPTLAARVLRGTGQASSLPYISKHPAYCKCLRLGTHASSKSGAHLGGLVKVVLLSWLLIALAFASATQVVHVFVVICAWGISAHDDVFTHSPPGNVRTKHQQRAEGLQDLTSSTVHIKIFASKLAHAPCTESCSPVCQCGFHMHLSLSHFCTSTNRVTLSMHHSHPAHTNHTQHSHTYVHNPSHTQHAPNSELRAFLRATVASYCARLSCKGTLRGRSSSPPCMAGRGASPPKRCDTFWRANRSDRPLRAWPPPSAP
eukprot:scaffold90443_cov20-Tisochrysis_lutea.AAC.1